MRKKQTRFVVVFLFTVLSLFSLCFVIFIPENYNAPLASLGQDGVHIWQREIPDTNQIEVLISTNLETSVVGFDILINYSPTQLRPIFPDGGNPGQVGTLFEQSTRAINEIKVFDNNMESIHMVYALFNRPDGVSGNGILASFIFEYVGEDVSSAVDIAQMQFARINDQGNPEYVPIDIVNFSLEVFNPSAGGVLETLTGLITPHKSTLIFIFITTTIIGMVILIFNLVSIATPSKKLVTAS